jgi:hypothetical protein
MSVAALEALDLRRHLQQGADRNRAGCSATLPVW